MTEATLEDVTREAAENTSKALSKLLNREVGIEFLKVGIKKVDDLCPLIPAEEIVAGILMPVTGDAEGAALLVFPDETALALTEFLMDREPGTSRQLTEFDKSALSEVGNIIVGAYLTVVSNTVAAKLIEHVPEFAYDMFGAIISQVVAKFAEEAEDVFVVEIEFAFPPESLRGYFLLVFRKADSERIFGALEGK